MCTNVGATGASVQPNGKVYIGSNSDDPYDIRTRVIVKRPPDGYAYVGTDLASLSGDASAAEYSSSVSGAPTRALNEKGLAFTWALAFERPDHQPPEGALKPHAFWSTVMQRCATVDEALELMPTLARDMAAIALLADAGGGLAQVEIGRRRMEVTARYDASAGGSVANVNCWIAMLPEEGDPSSALDLETAPNGSRFRRVTERLGTFEGKIDLAAMKAILSDHGYRERFAGENTLVRGHGFSVCNHGSLHKASFDPDEPAWGTVSAEIIDPMDGIFWYVYGWPCGEPPEHGDHFLQDRAWGKFVGFPLAALPEGSYTTLTGELTHLGVKHLGSLVEFDVANDQVSQMARAAGLSATS